MCVLYPTHCLSSEWFNMKNILLNRSEKRFLRCIKKYTPNFLKSIKKTNLVLVEFKKKTAKLSIIDYIICSFIYKYIIFLQKI
jgi:hypothetical protein